MAYSLEQTKIAKRYVNSLFSAVTKKTDSDIIAKDMADLGSMINSSADFQLFIKSPLLSVDQQTTGIQALAKKAKLSPIVTNLLRLLAENRRLSLLPVLVYQVDQYLAKQSGIVPVSVVTARPLSSVDQKKIQTDIKAVLGTDILMQTYVDEGLIGGLVVQVESTLIDGSLKTKLDKLERQMTGQAA